MIGLVPLDGSNSVDSAAATRDRTDRSQSLQELESTAKSSAAEVMLQSRMEVKEKSSASQELDRAGAAAYARDIAAMFNDHGMKVQANINGFDAARLLS